jgi:hypothetical protein
LENLGLQIRDLIENILYNSFILDIGIVTAVNGGGATVDVEHAIQLNKLGTVLPPTVTKHVEVVWAFPGNWTLANGDIVLLVGLKDYLKTAYVSAPASTDIPLHYTQMTMKAIPLYSSMHQAQITIDGSNLVHIKNAAASLYTAIQNFIQGVQGGTYGGSGTPGPFVDTTGKVALALTQLGQILGA